MFPALLVEFLYFFQQFSKIDKCAVTKFRITAIFGTIAHDANEWAGKYEMGKRTGKFVILQQYK